MKKLWMGEHYVSENGTHIKTIMKAISMETGKPLVIFVVVGNNGEAAGEPAAMPEGEFADKFLREPVKTTG